MRKSHTIEKWQQFDKRIRTRSAPLLSKLSQFPGAILITGCQRSGTTILTRIIYESEGMTDYRFGRYLELDAALILSGVVPHRPKGKYCFQTTYLNGRYHEYFDYFDDHKMIWMLRNPCSVVYSMLYNWRRFALNNLFSDCGVSACDPETLKRYKKFGTIGVSRLKKACFAYIGKTSQLFELKAKLPKDKFAIADYDDLIENKDSILPKIFNFLNLEYKPEYGQKISKRSVGKSDLLPEKEEEFIKLSCEKTYFNALKEVTIGR